MITLKNASNITDPLPVSLYCQPKESFTAAKLRALKSNFKVNSLKRNHFAERSHKDTAARFDGDVLYFFFDFLYSCSFSSFTVSSLVGMTGLY